MGKRSRIEAVETLRAEAGWRSFVFVMITTDDGVTGVGEATLEYHEETVAAAVSQLGQAIRGVDASRIEWIWQRLYRGGFWRGGPVLMSAISGIDQALWDIKGKTAGMPVYELLGGACRDYVSLYANGPRGATTAELATSAASLTDRGFSAMKLAAAGPVLAVDDESAIDRTRQDVAAIRDAVGSGVRIAIDAHGRYSPAMVVRLARALEPLDVWFLEEPVLPENSEALARVAASTTIPLALGERLHSRWDFRPFIEGGFLALAQPDLAHCGGISEGRRIASLAELHQVGFAPHNPMSPVNTAASAHLAMATPNFVALEYLVDEVEWASELLAEPLDVRDGRLVLSDRPGLGIELNVEACRAHPPTDVRRPGFDHVDGAVAEW
ncbi:MAG: galactonate dehydratase [Chloroflexota bacterium]|nr:galactonate dehydratase [Chloroflexota bacterium]